MAVLISNDAGLDMPLDEEGIEEAVQAVLLSERIERPCSVSISLVDRSEMQALNLQWRGIDAPTDVLSFECDDPDDDSIPEGEEVELGDVILAPEVIAEQASAFGNTAVEEFRLMFVHGLLHLLGYDHMDEDEALAMEARELEVLRALAAARGEDPALVKIGPTTRHEYD